jgi:hypothetical protein
LLAAQPLHIFLLAVLQIWVACVLQISKGELFMSSVIDPETATPTTTQAFEQSDRNPAVALLGGSDADGGQIVSPAASESRVTQPGPAPSANAGLQNYDIGDSDDAVEDEAEREG